jgi:hypothetical protein
VILKGNKISAMCGVSGGRPGCSPRFHPLAGFFHRVPAPESPATVSKKIIAKTGQLASRIYQLRFRIIILVPHDYNRGNRFAGGGRDIE